MSSLSEEIATAASVRKPPPRHPDGWTPGVEWNGTSGTITGHTDNRQPDWRSLLLLWNFDPDQYEIVEPVQVRTWDAAIGGGEVRRLWYHRAHIRQRRQGAPDVDELLRSIRRRRPVTRNRQSEQDGAYFLAFNDWQIGKKGTAAAVERIGAAIDDSVKRVRDLRRIGRKIGTIYLPGVGDLTEATSGHYPMQPFEVELNGREQARVARRLVAYGIERHAPLADRIICPAIGGNHGEKRVDGKAVTDFADNVDLEIYEGAAEAFARAPGYDHVRFLIPHDELTLTIQPVEDGPIVGLAHGHSSRGPKGRRAVDAGPLGKITEWWKGQMFGGRPVGDADILLVGHFHQLLIHHDGKRVLIVAPTIDSGSQWFAETVGVDSQPGMLSFLVHKNGWGDPQVL